MRTAAGVAERPPDAYRADPEEAVCACRTDASQPGDVAAATVTVRDTFRIAAAPHRRFPRRCPRACVRPAHRRG